MRSVLALLLAATIVAGQLTPLPNNVTGGNTAANVTMKYAYLPDAEALFMEVTVTWASKTAGLVNLATTYNGTTQGVWSFYVANALPCAFDGTLVGTAPAPTPGSPWHTWGKTISSANGTMNISFQLQSIDGIEATNRTWRVFVGEAADITNGGGTCAYASVRTPVFNTALSTNAGTRTIASASSGCAYGSPTVTPPYSCRVCFAGWTPFGVCNTEVTDPPPTTTRFITPPPAPVTTMNMSNQTNTTVPPRNGSTTTVSSTAAPMTTLAPGVVQLITCVTEGELVNFSRDSFVAALISGMAIAAQRLVYVRAAVGSVSSQFYFTDAQVGETAAQLTTRFIDDVSQGNNTFTQLYTILSVSVAVSPIPSMNTTTAPPALVSEGEDDSGLSRTQIIVIVIAVIVVIIIIIAAIIFYVRRNSDSSSGGRRNNAYEDNEMAGVGPGSGKQQQQRNTQQQQPQYSPARMEDDI